MLVLQRRETQCLNEAVTEQAGARNFIVELLKSC